MRFLANAAFTVAVGAAFAGCGGEKGPPRHPAGEMAARVMGRIDVLELIVADPARAERVRELYLQLGALGRQFDLARARAIVGAQAALEKRSTEAAQSQPANVGDLEAMLAPPLEEGKALFEHYTALMLEVRSLLTQDEFEKLNRVR